MRYIHIELLDQSPPPLASNGPIRVGDKVRVKSSVVTPKYKWGSVNHRNIGVVTSKWKIAYLGSIARYHQITEAVSNKHGVCLSKL